MVARQQAQARSTSSSSPVRSQGPGGGRVSVRRLGSAAALIAAVAAIFASASSSWSRASSVAQGWGPIRPWDTFFSVTSVGSGKWYVVGKDGVLLTSSDDGRTWTRRQLAQRGDLSWYDLYSVRFANDRRSGWISGENGIILHTSDGGATWSGQNSVVKTALFRIVPINSQKAVAAGVDGTLPWTDDAGNTWHPQSFKGEFSFLDLTFGDDNNGWAVGEFATVIHTADGGRTWTLQHGGNRADFRAPAYMSATFLDGKRGWAAGQGGAVISTSDGGNTWQPASYPVDIPIYGASFTAQPGGESRVWFAGAEGTLFSVSAAATGGSPVTLRPAFTSLVEVAVSAQTGIAVGSEGTILRTDDGGKSWKQVEIK